MEYSKLKAKVVQSGLENNFFQKGQVLSQKELSPMKNILNKKGEYNGKVCTSSHT